MDTTTPHGSQTPATPDTPQPYVARTPEDVLATVPLVLGFEPAESVVMLTFGAPRTFHARVDLPRHPDLLPELVRTLLEPALAHAVPRVLLVGYDHDGPWTGEVLRTVAAGMEAAGIEVMACLRADAGRWWPVDPGRSGTEEGPGSAYDAAAHRFRTRAVVEGRVTLPDRRSLAAGLEPGADGPAPGLLAALAEQAPPSVRQVDALVSRLVGTGARPTDEEVASLLDVASAGRLRDRVSRRLARATAAGHVALWSEVVRRAPGDRVADAAALLALCAWVSGDGALAWCAVDRAEAAQPHHRLAQLVATLLQAAVPPDEWEAMVRPLAG